MGLVGQTCRDPLGVTLPMPGSIAVLVAFVADHVSVAHWPDWIAVGLAVSEAVGAAGGGAVTVTVATSLATPPAPIAVRR